MSDPNSMLAKMFDPESSFSGPGVKKDGAYFLDRDPVNFGAVLNYLRSGHLEKDCNVPALLKEASFFGLLGLEADLHELAKQGDQFLLNVCGQLFVTSKATLLCMGQSRLARMVRGDEKQEFDKEGNLFLDFNPKYFSYVLDALRLRGSGVAYRANVPRGVFLDVWSIANSLGLDFNRNNGWSDLFQSVD